MVNTEATHFKSHLLQRWWPSEIWERSKHYFKVTPPVRILETSQFTTSAPCLFDSRAAITVCKLPVDGGAENQ